MDVRTLIFVALGSLALSAGLILTLVAAFRQHVLWGLAVLFIPLANFAYTIRHWAQARVGFYVSLAGVAFLGVSVASSPGLRALAQQAGRLSQVELPTAGFALQPPAEPSLDEKVQNQRTQLEAMEAKFAHEGKLLLDEYHALNEQRRLLKSSDAAAVDAFNKAVASYQVHNQARQTAKNELDAARLVLETLLDTRARQKSGLTPAGTRRVVMFSTPSCPACVMAKAYFAKKGVAYEERNVNASPEARAEFEKLGGRGVPLILVGNERMEGFSAQRLDQLL